MTLDDININILKSIAGKDVEKFPCTDLPERIKFLCDNGYIACSDTKEFRLRGGEFSQITSYSLTAKGQRKSMSLEEANFISVGCWHCGNYLKIVQRHTMKFQAICMNCGLRSPFMDTAESAGKWAKEQKSESTTIKFELAELFKNSPLYDESLSFTFYPKNDPPTPIVIGPEIQFEFEPKDMPTNDLTFFKRKPI